MASKKDPKEFTIPMALISLSVLIYGASGFSEEGAEGAMGVIVVIGLYMIFGVISGIAGFYIASGLFGMAYGNLLTAIPKMAAVVLFPGSIASLAMICDQIRENLRIVWHRLIGLLSGCVDEPFAVRGQICQGAKPVFIEAGHVVLSAQKPLLLQSRTELLHSVLPDAGEGQRASQS